jgi:hypothetical protein
MRDRLRHPTVAVQYDQAARPRGRRRAIGGGQAADDHPGRPERHRGSGQPNATRARRIADLGELSERAIGSDLYDRGPPALLLRRVVEVADKHVARDELSLAAVDHRHAVWIEIAISWHRGGHRRDRRSLRREGGRREREHAYRHNRCQGEPTGHPRDTTIWWYGGGPDSVHHARARLRPRGRRAQPPPSASPRHHCRGFTVCGLPGNASLHTGARSTFAVGSMSIGRFYRNVIKNCL